MEQKYIQSAQEILEKIHYINLATVNEDGTPWNTPVSASYDRELTFYWGSNPENVHSQNIRRNENVFVTIYDSTAPEGTGEAIYLDGKAKELYQENEFICKYQFTPEKLWINDEAKHEDGSYKHDIRAELDLQDLKLRMFER